MTCAELMRHYRYFVLPNVIRREIWEKTGIPRRTVMRTLLDYDAAVIKTKEAVMSWAGDIYKIEVRLFCLPAMFRSQALCFFGGIRLPFRDRLRKIQYWPQSIQLVHF